MLLVKPCGVLKRSSCLTLPGPGLYWSVLDDNRLRDRFQLYSMVGDRLSDGTSIRLSQSDKWFKEAGIINKEGFSTTDTDIAFRKISKWSYEIKKCTLTW